MIQRFFIGCLLAVLSSPGFAGNLTDAELAGRSLALELLEQTPAENSTIAGVLRIGTGRSKNPEVPIQCGIVITETGWHAVYETSPGTNSVGEKLVIARNGTNATRYEINGSVVSCAQIFVPFAGSDFWVADLGMEFLHWPAQRVLKKELRRSRSCTVLESTNPEHPPFGYSRVVSWIDRETGGIIHADAYDVKNKKVKEFDPKEFKKVNGQWQLQEMQIRNVQTRSRTSLEFDLDSR